jgi:hypothetical protein
VWLISGDREDDERPVVEAGDAARAANRGDTACRERVGKRRDADAEPAAARVMAAIHASMIDRGPVD